MDGNIVVAPALTTTAVVTVIVVPPLFCLFNRKEVQATKKKEMTTKANLVEQNSHKKSMRINLIKKFKSNGNSITVFKPKTNN